MSRAQERPRRWPDVLIGLLVLLLLAGFAVLLLGQRRPTLAQVNPATGTAAETGVTTSAAPEVDIPSAPGTEIVPNSNGPAPATDLGSGATPDATTLTGSGTSGDAAPGDATSQPASPEATAPSTSTGRAAPVTTAPSAAEPGAATPGTAPSSTPASGSEVATSPIPAVPAAPAAAPVTLPVPETTPAAQAQLATPPAPAAVPTAAPRSGGAVATSEQRMPLRSDYRISLGTFGSETLAQSRTQSVRDLGYTVYPIDVGSQVVAQVGPFADEASARQALADIQQAYPGALLYPPRNRSLSQADSTSAVPEAAPSRPDESAASAPEAAPPPAASRNPAPSGSVYLQVGAFDRPESAQTLVGQLREQGYAPTVNAPEGRKVTVLIGPFSGAAVTAAEEKLDANGFDHFRVR